MTFTANLGLWLNTIRALAFSHLLNEPKIAKCFASTYCSTMKEFECYLHQCNDAGCERSVVGNYAHWNRAINRNFTHLFFWRNIDDWNWQKPSANFRGINKLESNIGTGPKKGLDRKYHLSMFSGDSAWPAEWLHHFVSFSINRKHLSLEAVVLNRNVKK